MQEIDLKALATGVLWAAFGLSALFGAIAQRTHFCTMGAVSDIVTIGDWTRMRMWVMAMGVAMIGFNLMVAVGWLDAGKSIYGGPKFVWLSALVGGLLFGFGSVAARRGNASTDGQEGEDPDPHHPHPCVLTPLGNPAHHSPFVV